MDEERELPTRGEVAAVVCRGYGAFLLLLCAYSLTRIVAVNVSVYGTLFRPANFVSWIVSPWIYDVFVGLILWLGAGTMGGEMTGEIELADRRPLVRGDLMAFCLACAGLFCLTKALSEDVQFALGCFESRWTMSANWYGLGVLLSLNVGSFALAFSQGIRRRFTRPQTS
jgi:hypothetical protein